MSPLGLGWPNVISIFRILLAPVLVILVLSRSDSAAAVAAAVFVFGALTDGLDGYLARRYSGATALGQWLDPLADKILVTAPVVALAATGRFPAWAVVGADPWRLAVLWATIVLTVRSGLDYFWKAARGR
ncbi:MAG: CDP-alcohol phosphatidyltransferase family protein [Actinomycetota bacterium]